MRTESGLGGQVAIPLSSLKMRWPGTELNRRRQPFQGCALPPELPGHTSKPAHLPRATRIVRFTPIVAGLPSEKQLLRRTRAERFDYSKRFAHAQIENRIAEKAAPEEITLIPSNAEYRQMPAF